MLSKEAKKVKEELERFNQTKRRLRNLQDELASWQRLDGAVKSISYEQPIVGGENKPYAEKRVLRMEELEELISNAIDEAIELENEFLKDIADLDALSQNLLMERYMTGKSLKRIFREFNYSESHIYRLYDNAIEKISRNHKDESK